MKVVCVNTSYIDYLKKHHDISNDFIVGKIYEATGEATGYLGTKYLVINENGYSHIVDNQCFKPLREINLDKLI